MPHSPATAEIRHNDPRPPRGGAWHWQSDRLTRAWLPLVGLDGLGLLDVLLAYTDHTSGLAAITYAELVDLTGSGRAKLARIIRILEAAGLVIIHQAPVSSRGPAARRNLYQVQRGATAPTPEALERLAALAEHDPVLARRLAAYQAPRPAPVQFHHENGTSSMVEPVPVPPDDPVPFSPGNGSQDHDPREGIDPPPAVETVDSGPPLSPALWLAILAAAALDADPYLAAARPRHDADGAITIRPPARLPAAYRFHLARLARHASAILGRPVTIQEARP